MNREIAVIGMSGRFPASNSVGEFWQHLIHGRSGVKSIIPKPGSKLPLDPNFVAKAATVEQADCFDAGFFGILPRQAQEMDPQHRVFLETCWSALEDAGYRPDATEGLVGVFAGCHMNTYIFLRLAEDAALRETLADSFPGGNLNAEILNDKDYLATRISYHLNLRGPSVAVQSACSTSLVAIAQACKSLEAGDCRMALAGGACITFPQDQGYLHTEDSILSPDGFCRTFDADAKGTIFGDGVAAVVLKRLSDAIHDRDAIYAVIKGWGVNNDGGGKAGYTAPSISGQTGAIVRAYQKAGITAESISYVEAHGTGTLVGDPIEVAALTDAFRQSTDQKAFCAIGSLKSNFGHLDVAAGVAAVIKTALAIHHRQIPPNLHFQNPNPRIDFENSPFYVQTRITDWPERRISDQVVPRRAGVSSFGVGGTNAHVVMEEYSSYWTADNDDSQQSDAVLEHSQEAVPGESSLVFLSARSEDALSQMCDDLAVHLEAQPQTRMSDASFTLLAGRKPLAYRFSAAGRTLNEWVRQLREKRKFTRATPSPKLLFLFPGQGSQHLGMAKELYQADRCFAGHLDRSAEALKPHVGMDLRELAFANEDTTNRIDETAYAQPSLFMISTALAAWMNDKGIRPDFVAGHSVGEFAAATTAGIMSLEDGARLIAARGRLMQDLPVGSMLAVNLPADRLLENLPAGLEIAAFNSPLLNVVSGPKDAIISLERDIENGRWGEDVTCRLLRTSHAFHSAMMDPAIEPFGQIVAQCKLGPPNSIQMISTVTGQAMSSELATCRSYWSQQIRRPVIFSQTMSDLLAAEPNLVICEVGPNQALTTLIRRQSLAEGRQSVIPLLPHAREKESSETYARAAIGKLWQAGIELDAQLFFGATDHVRRTHLPTYRFERKRHWFQVTPISSDLLLETESAAEQPDSSLLHAQPTPPGSPTENGVQDSQVELVKQQMEIMKRQLYLLSHPR